VSSSHAPRAAAGYLAGSRSCLRTSSMSRTWGALCHGS
jgi:hypothetical protein